MKQITFEEARTELEFERKLQAYRMFANMSKKEEDEIEKAEITAATSGLGIYFEFLDEIMSSHTLHITLSNILNRNDAVADYKGDPFDPNQVSKEIVGGLRALFSDSDQYNDQALLIKAFTTYGEFFRF